MVERKLFVRVLLNRVNGWNQWLIHRSPYEYFHRKSHRFIFDFHRKTNVSVYFVVLVIIINNNIVMRWVAKELIDIYSVYMFYRNISIWNHHFFNKFFMNLGNYRQVKWVEWSCPFDSSVQKITFDSIFLDTNHLWW